MTQSQSQPLSDRFRTSIYKEFGDEVRPTLDVVPELRNMCARGEAQLGTNASPAVVEQADQDIRRFARDLVEAARVQRTNVITRNIFEQIKRLFCPTFPFC